MKQVYDYIIKILFFMSVALVSTQITFANSSSMLSLPDETSLYYEENGSGQSIIFIPGWTATHQFFTKQVAYFSNQYRVITFDPRGQGLSPATLNNNNYLQHGQDLNLLIQKLELKNVILVAWSWGCYDAYAYVREYGVKNIKAFVCIDAAPKAYGPKGQWKASIRPDDVNHIIQEMEHNRYEFTSAWVQNLVERPLNNDEHTKIIDEALRTPTYAAFLLMFDAMNSDYSPEAKLLDQSVPTLDFVSKAMSKDAKAWLKTYAPHTQVIVMGKHMMFWEYADKFNLMLEKFLADASKDSKMS